MYEGRSQIGDGDGFEPVQTRNGCSPMVIRCIHAERLRVNKSGVAKAAQRGDMLAEIEHFGGSILAQ